MAGSPPAGNSFQSGPCAIQRKTVEIFVKWYYMNRFARIVSGDGLFGMAEVATVPLGGMPWVFAAESNGSIGISNR